MRVKRLHETIPEQAEREYSNYMVWKQQSLIEYIAMMSDVELPEEETSSVENGPMLMSLSRKYESKKFEKVKKFFDNGYWTDEMVRNSVEKGWITESEYSIITGIEY